MKKHFRKPAIALAAALAAFTFTTGAGLAYAGSSRSGDAYEKCDARKDHSKHSHKKASKEWKKTLSDEQKTQMKELRANLKKELAPLKAQIMAKGAETGKISASDNPDMAAIAKLVDEISALEKKAMLSRYENMIKVRSLLTPEQKAAFDASMMEHSDHEKGHWR